MVADSGTTGVLVGAFEVAPTAAASAVGSNVACLEATLVGVFPVVPEASFESLAEAGKTVAAATAAGCLVDSARAVPSEAFAAAPGAAVFVSLVEMTIAATVAMMKVVVTIALQVDSAKAVPVVVFAVVLGAVSEILVEEKK